MPKRFARLRSTANKVREALFKSLFRARFRYDVFISYSHRDKDYAVNLKKQLTSLDFSCFIDEEESPPGSALDPTLAKALRKSAVFVLLATERALTRPYIVSEFEKFAGTGRTIVPINIQEALTKSDEAALSKPPWNIINERKVVWIDESDEAYAKNNPSPTIADGIDKLFKYTRRNTRVRTEIIGTAVLTVLLAFGAVFLIKGKAAEVSRLAVLAEVYRNDKEVQQEQAATARTDAETQRGIADEQKKQALLQTKLAAEAKEDATRQQQLARNATVEANKQQLVAKDAKLETERQLERNRHFLYDSDMNLAERASEAGDMARVYELLNAHATDSNAKNEEDQRSFYWYYLWHKSYPELPLTDPYYGPTVGHDGNATSVAFSPEGRILASASDNSTVKLWDTKTRQVLVTLTGHKDSVFSVAFSPDGKVLASASADHTVKLWATGTWNLLATIDTDYSVSSVAFSPDSRMLATAGNVVLLWDASAHKLLARFDGHTNIVRSVAFSPDGKTLASGSFDGIVKLWDINTQHPVAALDGHGSGIYSIAFSPDGKVLASACADSTVRLWDTRTHEPLGALEGRQDHVFSVAFSPDGKIIASGNGDSAHGDHTVKLWDVSSHGLLATLKEQSHFVFAVAFSPDGNMLASTSDDAVKLWDTSSRKELTTLNGHSESVQMIAFSPDSNMLVSVSTDRFGKAQVKLWDNRTQRELTTLTGYKDVNSIAFCLDGRTLALGVWNGVKLWDIDKGQESATFNVPRSALVTMTVSPDGKMIAWATGHIVTLWDIRKQQELATLKDDHVKFLAFSPDGNLLALVGAYPSWKVWDISNRRELAKFDRPSNVASVAFLPHSNTIASASSEDVNLWDTSARAEIASLKGHTGRVNSVAFSRDGKTLASASDDGTVKLWDPATGQELGTLKAHTGPVNSVAFSPDGKTLASVGADKTIRLWIAATKEEVVAKRGKQ